jgi:hypothetical protein
MLQRLHYEDIKASIRKKYGTLNAFERTHGLPHNSVNGWGRKKDSRRVQGAIERHLASLVAPADFPESSGSITDVAEAHLQNREDA